MFRQCFRTREIRSTSTLWLSGNPVDDSAALRFTLGQKNRLGFYSKGRLLPLLAQRMICLPKGPKPLFFKSLNSESSTTLRKERSTSTPCCITTATDRRSLSFRMYQPIFPS